MNAHTTKTYNSILGHSAPRNLPWDEFVAMWKDVAEDTDQESGDRLAVRMNGHQEVFHRSHDGKGSIEDVELARHLLGATPDVKGSGHLLVVAIDDRQARLIDFDLDAATATEAERHLRADDTRAQHLRTVERHPGHDDIRDLVGFFDSVASAIQVEGGTHDFVILGHGTGKSNAADAFLERLRTKHHELLMRFAGSGTIDLSAANDADLEAKAIDVTRHS